MNIPFSYFRVTVIGLLCLGCIACTVLERDSAEATHWKEGYVERIAAGSELKDIAIRECVSPLTPEVIIQSRFAVVSYWRGRWKKYRTVKLPNDSAITVGDAVRIDVANCSAPLLLNGKNTSLQDE